MGVLSFLKDFGLESSVTLRSDASAAIGITQRLGLGRVRHLAVGDLWIQQRVRRGDIDVEKVPGEKQPSDLMTKPLDGERIRRLLLLAGVQVKTA